MSESIRYKEIYEALKSEIFGGKYVPARSFPSSTSLQNGSQNKKTKKG